jgi:hypothetical protein
MLRSADQIEELRQVQVHKCNGCCDTRQEYLVTDAELNWLACAGLERDSDLAVAEFELRQFDNLWQNFRNVDFLICGRLKVLCGGCIESFRVHSRRVHYSLLDLADFGTFLTTLAESVRHNLSLQKQSQLKSFSSLFPICHPHRDHDEEMRSTLRISHHDAQGGAISCCLSP